MVLLEYSKKMSVLCGLICVVTMSTEKVFWRCWCMASITARCEC
jgi:hypothetical protein